MDFIKKHYEKLILLLLLMIFIASMFHVLNIVKQTGEVKEHHLQIPTRNPDYVIHAPDDPIFDVSELMKTTSLNWVNPGPRDAANVNYYSDLVHVFPISRCPFCGKLIPRYFLDEQKACPFCENKANDGKAFVKPPPAITVSSVPDEIMKQLGYRAEEFSDAQYYDADGDGFSNIYEYWKKTDPGDPRSHPPLWYRLRVVDVGKIVLPVRLMALNTLDSDNPKGWEFQINNGRFSDLYMIGSELEIEGKFFRIVKAERKIEEPSDGKGARKDLSAIYLKEVDGDREIVMTVGGQVRSFSERAILEDSGNPGKRYTLNVGDSFSIGNRQTGEERYRVKSFDPAEKTVLLDNPNVSEGDASMDKDGVRMEITTFGQIPHQLQVRQPKPQANYGPEDGLQPPDAPRQNRRGR